MEPTAISVRKLTRKKFNVMKFEGDFLGLYGTPEISGSWVIYGAGGSGKSTIALRTMKYMTKFEKCAYMPLEQGTKKSFQDALIRENIISVEGKAKIWKPLTALQLIEELKKRKSPNIIFIDSLQYLRWSDDSTQELTRFQYKQLIEQFPKKLFVFVSHSKNDYPKGTLGDAVYYDCENGILVKKMVATPIKSRSGGNTQYIIQ